MKIGIAHAPYHVTGW